MVASGSSDSLENASAEKVLCPPLNSVEADLLSGDVFHGYLVLIYGKRNTEA